MGWRYSRAAVIRPARAAILATLASLVCFAAHSKEPTVYASNPDDIGPRLAELEKTMAAHGYDLKESFARPR